MEIQNPFKFLSFRFLSRGLAGFFAKLMNMVDSFYGPKRKQPTFDWKSWCSSKIFRIFHDFFSVLPLKCKLPHMTTNLIKPFFRWLLFFFCSHRCLKTLPAAEKNLHEHLNRFNFECMVVFTHVEIGQSAYTQHRTVMY